MENKSTEDKADHPKLCVCLCGEERLGFMFDRAVVKLYRYVKSLKWICRAAQWD